MDGTGIGYPALRGRKSADAAILGGGLSGLHTALLLSTAGLSVIVLEADRLLSGASGACAGTLSLLGGFSYRNLEANYGLESARKVAKTQQAALEKIKSLAPEGALREQPAALFARSEAQKRALDAERRAMERAGLETASCGAPPPMPFAGGFALPRQGALDIEAYRASLPARLRKQNCRIYERSRVVTVENGLCHTQTGSVRAPYIVAATGYPILTRPGFPMLKLDSVAAARLTLGAHTALDGAYIALDGGAMLSGAELTVTLGRSGCQRDAKALYRERYQQALGGAELLSVRTSRIIRAVDALPRIGAYGRGAPNLMIATGYGLAGIVGSMTAAQAISARVLGLPIDEYDVYDRRASGRAVFSISGNAAGQAGRYLIGMTRVLAPRCPHMGCKLRYSRPLHGWVCPCHGSSFDDLGQVRAAPAVDDAQIKHGR